MKYTFTILIAILSLTLGYGQDQKIAEKAEQKVEEINQLIISENPDLELTAEQKETLLQLHVQKLKDIRTINKSEATEDEKKNQPDFILVLGQDADKTKSGAINNLE